MMLNVQETTDIYLSVVVVDSGVKMVAILLAWLYLLILQLLAGRERRENVADLWGPWSDHDDF